MKQVITFMQTDVNTARAIYDGKENGTEIEKGFQMI